MTFLMNISLWDLGRNEKATLTSFCTTLDDNYRIRLLELGFQPGANITCVVAPKLGAPKLYRVDNTVYSLDEKVAMLLNAIKQVL